MWMEAVDPDGQRAAADKRAWGWSGSTRGVNGAFAGLFTPRPVVKRAGLARNCAYGRSRSGLSLREAA